MEAKKPPSRAVRILAPIAFLIGGLGALVWFVRSLYHLILHSGDNLVLVDKGSFYMLGVSIGLLILGFVMIWETWLFRPLTDKATKVITTSLVASVVLLFIVPHVLHFIADYYLSEQGYQVCEAASRRWLHSQEIAYTQSPEYCTE